MQKVLKHQWVRVFSFIAAIGISTITKGIRAMIDALLGCESHVIDSLTHGAAEVGRDLWRLSRQGPFPKTVDQNCGHLSFENLHRWKLHDALSNLFHLNHC